VTQFYEATTGTAGFGMCFRSKVSALQSRH